MASREGIAKLHAKLEERLEGAAREGRYYPIVGRLINNFGYDLVEEAILRMSIGDYADPASYLTQVCKNLVIEKQKKPQTKEKRTSELKKAKDIFT